MRRVPNINNFHIQNILSFPLRTRTSALLPEGSISGAEADGVEGGIMGREKQVGSFGAQG